MTPSKPQTYIADLTRLPKALRHITTMKRWVLWRWEKRVKKNGEIAWTKPPYQGRHPKLPAKSNDPNTWGTYEEALKAVAAGQADGIGFALKDSEVAAADLDHVRDAKTGELLDWARRLCVEADSLGLYREITVSGSGLRFIGLSQGTELHRKFTFNRKTGAGIELYRNTARYITISGLQEGHCDDLTGIDGYLDQLLARFDGSSPPVAASSSQGRSNASNFDFNDAGPQQQSEDYYRDLIENGAPEGERSEKFHEVVWYLASLGWSIEAIVDELAKYPDGIGLKYAARLLTEVIRSFAKWRSRRRAGAVRSSAPAGTPWPQIQIKPGELPRVVNEAEDALLLLGREIYQRGGLMVRPVLTRSLKASADRETEAWQLIQVTRPYLVESLCCAAQFQRYDKRGNKWRPVDAPDKVADAYLNRQGSWRLPLLVGVTNTPFLRVDGSICETPGYDSASHLLFKPEGERYLPVPQHPSKPDAAAALVKLRKLIATFPFVTPADMAVALVAMLTVLDRRSVTTAPLIAFTSPAAGTGKSLLVDLMSVLATGRLMPVLSQGKSEEEFEKRLGASLLAGDVCIAIDNCEAPLSGALLCQALTQGELNIRLLGYSRNVGAATNATIFATGNNLVIAGDLTRRRLLGSLDAGVERPELRSFNVDVIEQARVRRDELVVAALTILRAWHVAREAGEQLTIEPFGGFTDWSCRVREPLIWLGEADPCDTVTKVRENDPHRDLLYLVVMQWSKHLVLTNRYTVQEVIDRAINIPSFQSALLGVAEGRAGMVSNRRLGRWLKHVEGKIVSGFRLVQDGIVHGYPKWKLIHA
jgi:hypothetical protein